jgi:hypothetical protein
MPTYRNMFTLAQMAVKLEEKGALAMSPILYHV